MAMEKMFHWSLRLALFFGIALLFMVMLSVDGSARTITVDDDETNLLEYLYSYCFTDCRYRNHFGCSY